MDRGLVNLYRDLSSLVFPDCFNDGEDRSRWAFDAQNPNFRIHGNKSLHSFIGIAVFSVVKLLDGYIIGLGL